MPLQALSCCLWMLMFSHFIMIEYQCYMNIWIMFIRSPWRERIEMNGLEQSHSYVKKRKCRAHGIEQKYQTKRKSIHEMTCGMT